MLDMHALTITPGSGTTLGSAGTVAGNDGAQTAGVPIGGSAGTLRMWGFQSVTADTVAAIKLSSQDQVDPVDGVTYVPGAASLLVQFYDYTTLQYQTGTRLVTAGTNTGVTAGSGFLVDEYKKGVTMALKPYSGNEVVVGATTFGAALVKDTWSSQPFSAPNLPAGKYAIVGAFVSAITNVALIRFAHNDFQGLKPGFPVANYELAMAVTTQVAMRDDLVSVATGEQFIFLVDALGSAQCPVFSVSNAGTGLNIEMLSEQTDTPVVNLVLMKVG